MTTRFVVLDGYTMNPGDNPWTELLKLGEVQLHDRTALNEIVPRSLDADAIITNKVPLSAETLAQLPRLKLIAVSATGYNIVDVKAARARGVSVVNVPEYRTDNVAQFVFALLLELAYRVGLHDQLVHQGEWSRSRDFCFWRTPQLELAGLTMGIVGFGRIGRRVGELAHAFGMNVLAQTRSEIPDPPSYSGFRRTEALESLFAEADVVSLHCPQTLENTGVVNRALLTRMKPSAFFINTARGGLVNEQDLADALNNNLIAAAALDVVSAEPIHPENPLLNAKNTIITPHIAWATLAARRRLMCATVENICAFLAGSPINVVN